jgi:hypothetical protein
MPAEAAQHISSIHWLLKRGKNGAVHSAVQEGGGTMKIMMTACGVDVRWDQPHAPWVRAQWKPDMGPFRNHITCRRCQG